MNIPSKSISLLPKNLYHITTVENLKKIKSDNCIKAMPDTLTAGKVKGVFVFDLNNFVTQWAKDKHMNLARLILDYIAKGKEMVALRIPLAKLPQEHIDNIKTRDVNKVIDWKFNSYRYGKDIPEEILGKNIEESAHLQNTGIAVEHILPEDIEFGNVEELGTSFYQLHKNLAEIMQGFFKNHPEEEIIEKNIDILM